MTICVIDRYHATWRGIFIGGQSKEARRCDFLGAVTGKADGGLAPVTLSTWPST